MLRSFFAKRRAQPASVPASPKAPGEPNEQVSPLRNPTLKKLLAAQYKLVRNQKKEKERHKKEVEEWKKRVAELEKRVREVQESAKKDAEATKKKYSDVDERMSILRVYLYTSNKELGKTRKELDEMREKLREANLELRKVKEEKELLIQQLEEESMESTDEEDVETLLEVLQEAHEILESGDVLKKAVEKEARLASISTQETVKQMAKLELEAFRAKLEDYRKAIEANISKIQENADCPREDLLPIPKLPVLSELFEQELFLAEKENEELGEQCLICLDDKPSGCELSECSHCQVTYHAECIADWLKRQSVCPVCEAEM